MILICDLGLSVYRQYTLGKKLSDKDDFSAYNTRISPFGEGYNLSRLLAAFGQGHSLLGFSDGPVEENLRKDLNLDLVDLNLISIKDKSSEFLYLNFPDKKIKILDKETKISRDEIVEFYSTYKEGLNLNELICLVGDKPTNLPGDLTFNIGDLSHKWGRKIFLAVNDKTYFDILETRPFAIILNKRILEDLTNLSLDFENEIIKACNYLLDKGIAHIIIDNNENGLIILNKDHVHKLSLKDKKKQVNISHGGVLGGFILSLVRDYDIKTLCKLTYACGLVDYFEDEIETSHIKSLMKDIDLFSFNNI